MVTQQHSEAIEAETEPESLYRVHHSPAATLADRRLGRGMSVSILVIDDEPDVADRFRQRFRREVREGTYVMHLRPGFLFCRWARRSNHRCRLA